MWAVFRFFFFFSFTNNSLTFVAKCVRRESPYALISGKFCFNILITTEKYYYIQHYLIERERIDHIRLLLLSSLMLLLFLLGIAVLLSFVGLVHLSVKGKLISSTLLLLKNVSGPYPKKSSTTSVTLDFPHLFAQMAL